MVIDLNDITRVYRSGTLSVGARGPDILLQFLIESVVLCLLGGLGGILLGVLATELVASYAGWPAIFSTEAMIVAVTVSAAVGVFFGFYPAWKASRLDPITALRREETRFYGLPTSSSYLLRTF